MCFTLLAQAKIGILNCKRANDLNPSISIEDKISHDDLDSKSKSHDLFAVLHSIFGSSMQHEKHCSSID